MKAEEFALNIEGNDLLKRQLQDKSEAEIQFYVVHGFLPYPEEQKPTQLASAEAPQLPQSTTEQQSPTHELEPAGKILSETKDPGMEESGART